MQIIISFSSYKFYGIKTIINLRGKRDCSSYYLEVKTCKELNIKLVNFPISSRAAPKTSDVVEASNLFKKIKYPALLHCKSGADRHRDWKCVCCVVIR